MGHVRDRWMTTGASGRKARSDRWGHGKRWQARWVERGVEKSKTFTTRDAAEAHLAKMQLGGPSRVVSRLTVREFAAIWEAGQLHYAASSAKAAHQRIHVQLLPTLGDVPIAEVTRSDMQALVGSWTKTHAPASVRQAFSFTSTMFAAAVRDGLILTSPCVEVNLPPKNRSRVQPLSVEQVETIAGRVMPRYRSMVVVCAATGLRGAELRGLTTDRIQGGDLRIDRQMLDVVDGLPIFGPPKSQAGERNVALGRVAREALEAHLAEYEPGVSGLVWTTRQHGPIGRKTAARIWHDATEGMGLPDRDGWHELRHHHASVLIAAGFSAKAVAERMGHADASEVYRTYVHLFPSDHARMVDAVDAALVRLGPSENAGAEDLSVSVP